MGLDERLAQLLHQLQQADAQNSSSSTLENLLKLIPQLPGLRRSSHSDYGEALNKTLFYVQNHVAAKFQYYGNTEPPELQRERFVRWVNGYLKYRILDLYRQSQQPLSLDVDISPLIQDSISFNGIDSLIAEAQKKQQFKQSTILENYIERDPKGKLSCCYPANCPECNCQYLATELFLKQPGGEVAVKEGDRKKVIAKAEKKTTFRAIAQRFDLSEQTVHSHWKRKCRSLLREVLQSYQADFIKLDA